MATLTMAMLISRDLARSRDFYRDVLGLKVRVDSPGWVDFDLGGPVTLGIHPPTEDLQVTPGSLQLGFEVEDVDVFVEEARAKGVPIVMEPMRESFGRLALILDPDGYTVQMFTPAPRG